jgi:DNA helicase-2/ATP-dependent DNA helicase PcrA
MLPSDKQIEGLNRAGALPEVVKLGDDRDAKKQLSEDIKKLQESGPGSIAILCKTSEECDIVYKQLVGEVELRLIAKDEDLYKRGVNVLPSYLCKGLEFDAVLVYGADAESYHTDGDRRLLYTLCTRALHRLTIYYKGELTSIIKEINGEFYTHIE